MCKSRNIAALTSTDIVQYMYFCILLLHWTVESSNILVYTLYSILDFVHSFLTIAERIAETDARIKRAMEERELLLEHLLKKLQAQYPGSENVEGSNVQLVQMCATLAAAGKQLAAVQDTSEWATRKRSLSRIFGMIYFKVKWNKIIK